VAFAPSEAPAFPAAAHDHQGCIARAVDTALAICEGRGVRLTELRRRVLELVWTSHAPVGAYDILQQLQRDRKGAAPPTVYRALEFLLSEGLIHRLDSLSAYVGCPHPERSHISQFLICTACSGVAEIDSPGLREAILDNAAAAGFTVSRSTVELQGLCPPCAARQAQPDRPAPLA
jgi:Fur family zinc uptake transcriptional regulator